MIKIPRNKPHYKHEPYICAGCGKVRHIPGGLGIGETNGGATVAFVVCHACAVAFNRGSGPQYEAVLAHSEKVVKQHIPGVK